MSSQLDKPEGRKFQKRVAEGVDPAQAVKNVGHDQRQLATYLYRMMSDYTGGEHEAYAVEVMQQTFEALSDDTSSSLACTDSGRDALLYMADRFKASAEHEYGTQHGKSMAAAYRIAEHACRLEADDPKRPSADTPAATGTIDLAKAREVATQNVGPYDAALARSGTHGAATTPTRSRPSRKWMSGC